jgi:hypothetical protein
LHDISEDHRLIFASRYGDEDAYSNICIVTNILYRDWTNPYLKVMEWHNLKKGSVEDVLSIFDECKKKYGD